MGKWVQKRLGMKGCMGKGYGVRNTEGEMLLEFAGAKKLVVLNTWFTKNKSKKVTYESGGNKSVVDYMFVSTAPYNTTHYKTANTTQHQTTRHKWIIYDK